MAEMGFTRTVEQIRCHWKSLRLSYYKAIRQNSSSGSDPGTCVFFDALDELLGHRPLSTTDSGVDVGFADDPTPGQGDNAASSISSPATSDTVVTEDPEDEMENSESFKTQEADQPHSAPQQPGPTTRQVKRPRRSAQQHSENLERLQHQHQAWMANQMRQQQERDDQFMSSLMESNAQTTEQAVTLMLDGLQRLMPPIPPQMYSPHPYTTLYRLPNYTSTPKPPNNDDSGDAMFYQSL
ncbi:uncharacterized protein LOC144463768 [Epinephelus lanceolatus]